MTISQLEFLLKILTLDTTHCVLDMGCGLGMISEYISAVTGAAVTGLDIAEGAIEQAKERTKGKDRLTFVTGDFNKLEFDENSFDTVICIEAFYTGLDTTVRQLKKIISPGGQMGIHLMQKITPNDPRERLLPENTDLSIVLKKYTLQYRTWDFTSYTLDLFRNWIKASKELQSQFEAENNLDLCNIGGHEKLLHLWETEDCMRQYLYHVVL
jgi:2-polyprenyl-3-methyl-5-hydroxy-6-metoxy-1,4-benzoquinol methylase